MARKTFEKKSGAKHKGSSCDPLNTNEIPQKYEKLFLQIQFAKKLTKRF